VSDICLVSKRIVPRLETYRHIKMALLKITILARSVLALAAAVGLALRVTTKRATIQFETE
jgi:hypothetical protein